MKDGASTNGASLGRFSASVRPPQKYSATLMMSMNRVACAQLKVSGCRA